MMQAFQACDSGSNPGGSTWPQARCRWSRVATFLGVHKTHQGGSEVGVMQVRFLGVLVALALLLSGCSGGSDPDARGNANDVQAPGTLVTLPGFTPAAVADVPTFLQPALIDTTRAGGEPVIAITQTGTILVSAHPGFTHYHPPADGVNPPDEILTPFAGQSYLWRSTDNGTTWTHIGLPNMEEGPRSLGLGVSDPEFTVMMDGTICYTDLEALAMSSVSCSVDDGLTWMPGNPIASGGATDRQWIASYGDEFYFTANYFTDHHLRASTDRGLTWEDRGDVPCSQDLVANPANGHLIVACGAGLSVSEDAGWTWTDPRAGKDADARRVPDANSGGSRIMSEPAIDSAGNIWVTYTRGEEALYAAGTPDEGLTWPWVYDLTPHVKLAFQEGRLGGDFVCVEGGACTAEPEEPGTHATNGTYVWPWISAGSNGRVAVTWIGAFERADSDEYGGNWYIFSTYLIGAETGKPQIIPVRVTPDPIHEGPICQGGTGCQVQSMQGIDSGDRRLGDFFETTVGPDGYLYGAWSNTYKQPDDVISHPEFSRQVGGVRLISDNELGVFFPTQG